MTERARISGFTLIEVMVALVVLGIGVLGIAALQYSALRNNQQSYQRSQAILLAYDIADLMRANRAQAGTNAYALAVNTTPGAAPVDCYAATCTAAQLAAHDLLGWHGRVLNTIHLTATASIACSVNPCSLGAMQTVRIFWDELRVGVTDTSCPAGAAFDPSVHLSCVTVSFSP